MTHPIQSPRTRRGMTLIEVMVALCILGTVLLALGLFSANFSRQTSASRLRITAAQWGSQRLEDVKSAKTYASIESLYVKTEAGTKDYAGFTRQTAVTRTGGGVADTIDYKTVTVTVTNPQMKGSIKKTTVIAPF